MLLVPPSPAHGFAPIGAVSVVYLALVLGASYSLWVLGAPDLLVAVGAVAVAAGLFGPFLAVSRRLAPDPPEVE